MAKKLKKKKERRKKTMHKYKMELKLEEFIYKILHRFAL